MSTTGLSNDHARASALVVYESMFGNTKAVAEAVALGLSSTYDVELVECSRAPSAVPDDVAIVVVGAPTHAFGLSRESTREDARRQCREGDQPSESGLREWLDGLSRRPRAAGQQTLTAAFDTKVSHPRLPGSAAHAAARRLKRLGYGQLAAPQTFFVEGSQGPLVDGSSDAAFEWGRELSALAQGAARRTAAP
jgi:hypothetical protein